jgi:hypothetical protein
MKSIRRFSFFKLLVLVIGLMGASAVPAHAQSASGTFVLAHKVRWGVAVLPPGKYTFLLDSEPARVTVRQVDGPNIAILVPQVMTQDELTHTSTLVLHQEGGEAVVSRLRLGTLGVALEFASAKQAMPVAETARLESQPAK